MPSYKHSLNPEDTGDNLDEYIDNLNNFSLTQKNDATNKLQELVKTSGILDEDKKTHLIDKVRESVNKQLSGYYTAISVAGNTTDHLGNTRTASKNQKAVVDIVDSEIDHVNKQIEYYEQDLTNKKRMVEINDYYNKKYNSQTDILKVISGLCVLIIGIILVNNKNLISNNITNVLIGLSVGGALIIILLKLGDILIRDNHIFDEFDWFNTPNKNNLKTDNGGGRENVNENKKLTCPLPANLEDSLDGGKILSGISGVDLTNKETFANYSKV